MVTVNINNQMNLNSNESLLGTRTSYDGIEE